MAVHVETLYLDFGIKTYIKANIGDESPIVRDATDTGISTTEDRAEKKTGIPMLQTHPTPVSYTHLTLPTIYSV